jgi:hypothetical protein
MFRLTEHLMNVLTVRDVLVLLCVVGVVGTIQFRRRRRGRS